MIEFKNKIVQFGFGAVGKSFFEKIRKEIKFDIDNYYVISANKLEYTFFLEMGGKFGNFIVKEIKRDNYEEVFSSLLGEGDFLVDFADSVGTKDFVEWCAKNNVYYLNTGETDWPDNWYSIFNENIKKNNLRDEINKDNSINKYPIVLQHGNNPGLVSHFVKLGLEKIVKTQFKKDTNLNELLKNNKFNEIAKEIDLRQIHVNDNDFQEVVDTFDNKTLYSPWSIDSYFYEILSEATINLGTNEKFDYDNECIFVDHENGFLELKDIAIDKLASTYYPLGKFEGYIVPHEETITIAKGLEVKEGEEVTYRPTVAFIYSPCDYAIDYMKKARVSDDTTIDKTNSENLNAFGNGAIIRGFKYPERSEILYRENINKGTEYVGVLLIGSKFDPVWVGNRIEKRFLYKNKKNSFWQTPTITPVSMSALSAMCWMIKNKEKGGIYFPDDITDYKDIIRFAEKYISKTIIKTFKKEKVAKELDISFDNLNFSDLIKQKEG